MGMYVKSLEGLRKDRERTRRLGLVDRCKYMPSLQDIREATARIRQGWDAREREKRNAYGGMESVDMSKVVSTEGLLELEWFEGLVDKL